MQPKLKSETVALWNGLNQETEFKDRFVVLLFYAK